MRNAGGLAIARFNQKVSKIKQSLLRAVESGSNVFSFLKERDEMRWLFKAKAIANFGNLPVGVPEQNSGLLHNAAGDQLRSGLPHGCFQCPVQVIDVHREVIGKIVWRP